MDMLNVTGYQRRPPLLVGEYKGFFAKEGLEVSFHQTTYAPDHNRGMAEGSLGYDPQQRGYDDRAHHH